MSSKFGSDGYTDSQRRRNGEALRRSIENDKAALEALQQRLVDLGEPRMTEAELEGAAVVASEPKQWPQPKGRWINGRFTIPQS